MQQAAKERRQAMFRTLAATARLQSQLGRASPTTPPKAAPKVLVDRLQTELGKASPTTPPKTAPKVSLEVEASALDVEREGMVEGLEFASQFSPPCGTERQYLDMGPGQPTSPATGRGEESEDNRTLKAAKSAARRLLEDLVREQERLDTLEPPTASHMPFSVLEGARLGFLDPQQVEEFTQRANAAKNLAKTKPSAPPMAPPPPAPAQAPRHLPPPPRVPAQVHRDRFQPYPPMWIMPFPAPVAHPAPMMFPPPVARPTQMVPKPAPTMARWIARDTPVPTEAPKRCFLQWCQRWFLRRHRHLLQRRCRHLLRRRHRHLLQRRRRCLLQPRCQSLRHR